MAVQSSAMKKSIAVASILIFVGLSLYYFYVEDFCPVHNALPTGTFTHSHHGPASICLCFWSTLFSPASYDFGVAQDIKRLSPDSHVGGPMTPFSSDIGHPPKPFPA